MKVLQFSNPWNQRTQSTQLCKDVHSLVVVGRMTCVVSAGGVAAGRGAQLVAPASHVLRGALQLGYQGL